MDESKDFWKMVAVAALSAILGSGGTLLTFGFTHGFEQMDTPKVIGLIQANSPYVSDQKWLGVAIAQIQADIRDIKQDVKALQINHYSVDK